MIKLNRRGFIDRQRKGVVVGEEENRRTFFIFLSRALADVFEKNETKKKITSVYRLSFHLIADFGMVTR